MFRAAYERLADYYRRFHLAAFEEGGRRAEAEIASRMDEAAAAGPLALPPVAGRPPAVSPPPNADTTPPVSLPPLPPLNPVVAPKPVGDQTRRPPGRPKGSKNKPEPPPC